MGRLNEVTPGEVAGSVPGEAVEAGTPSPPPTDDLRREARRVTAGRRAASKAVAAAGSVVSGPASSGDGAGASLPSPPPVVPASDDLVAVVAATQAALAQAAERATSRDDPMRYMLAAFSDVLGALLKTTRRWEACVADVVAARQPFPPAERAAMADGVIVAAQTGAQLGAREEARRLVRGLDRAVAVRVGLCVGSAGVVGAALGCAVTLAAGGWFRSGPFDPASGPASAWAEIARNNPDPRRTLETARLMVDRATGRRYHEGVSLWADPPRPPPVGQR